MRMSDVDICNAAMSYLGSKSNIQLLTDKDNVNARRCNQIFASTVELVLREFPWSSASKRVKLAQNTSGPLFEKIYQYTLPPDCVFVTEVYGSTRWSPYDRWVPLGRKIQTDLSTAYLLYVAYPDNFQDLDVMLSESIALKLGIRLGPAYSRDMEQVLILRNLYEEALRKAKVMDTLEGKQGYTPNDAQEDARINEGNGYASF
jgi:hypothetical protein